MIASEGEAGMSIVEALVAMMIFALVSTGIIYTMLSVLSVSRDSRARQVALNLASQEIDLARDTQDLFAVLDATKDVTLNKDKFHVTRKTQWVSDPGASLQCGASSTGSAGATLRYKRVNISVTWDGMRESTKAVQSDTVISPKGHLNDPSLGTILVSVLSGDGTGRSNVTVTASPASPANGAKPLTVAPAKTDAQGCTYILKVIPGTYNVGVSATNYVSYLQEGTSSQIVGVAAGESAAVGFQYDAAATFVLKRAANFTPPPGVTVKFPTALDTTFISSYGAHVVTGTSAKLFPFSSGYTVLAGKYVAPADGIQSCLSVDPAAWLDGTVNGVAVSSPQPIAVAAAGGQSVDAPVAMGVVTVGGSGGGFVKAVSAAAVGDDPGCAQKMTYAFDNIGNNATIALPYGSWNVFRGSSATGATVPVPGAALVPLNGGTVTGNSVTFDPRVEVVP
ncbi:Type II secretory pathway, pseudopilin PulG [Sanguibacter gelidistatuariae]|uniref:Type II secretory pathway, pseudopilin PulG n=1 Tax=Sanguibacter gelidistatuariae TaxID=1814289 RepID=A0A1G6JRY6_9MICO|nr:type II secretion system protein [Sanguibacter gelidistatuariae]SDC21510.1 Type II secretory pathway, pseudopilin PulG [Sanguibacter gelidistatuariae]